MGVLGQLRLEGGALDGGEAVDRVQQSREGDLAGGVVIALGRTTVPAPTRPATRSLLLCVLSLCLQLASQLATFSAHMRT